MKIKTQILRLTLALALIALPALCAVALPVDYYKASSVLSSGKWLKVEVTATGIQEITTEQLREWGFKDPSRVTVWGYGGSSLTDNRFGTDMTDDLCQQYAKFDSNVQKLFFYGVAGYMARPTSNTAISVKRNVYSDTGCYFLCDGQPEGTTAPNWKGIYRSSSSTPIAWHTHLDYLEEDKYNPSLGGSFFFDRNILGEGSQSLSFACDRYYTGLNFQGTLLYRFASDYCNGIKLEVQNDNEQFTFKRTNRPNISSVVYDAIRKFLTSTTPAMELIRNTSVNDQSWDITLNIPAGVTGCNFVSLDYAALLYPRYNDMESKASLEMFIPGGKTGDVISLTNCPNNVQVWEVSDPMNVGYFTKTFSGSIVKVSLDRNYAQGAHIVAFNPSRKQCSPEIKGAVAAQNLHGEENPDMVIITPAIYAEQAERLARLHEQYQGFKVKVVDLPTIYNEFSSGTPCAMGVRRYAKMLYDRNPGSEHQFRYLLFFGLGTWDQRGVQISGLKLDELLITYQTEIEENANSLAKCYSSDAYFGMMDDNTTHLNINTAEMHISVGRMPLSNISDAIIAVDKVEDYFINPPVHGSYNRALLLCDDGDSNDHLNQMEEVTRQIYSYSPATTVYKVYNALYPLTGKYNAGADNAARGTADALHGVMKNYLAQGQGFFSYSGHGAPTLLGSHQPLWNISDIDVTEYPVAPFAMLATCDAFAFDRSSGDVAVHLILKPNGGAINVVGACRSVYKSYNQDLNKAVTRNYFQAVAGDCMGDVFRRARNDLNTTQSSPILQVNNLCYNLAGDPALPLYVPSRGVATVRINDLPAPADGQAAMDVACETPVKVEGEIINPETGEIDAAFNGYVTVTVYDGSYFKTPEERGSSDAGKMYPVEVDEDLLTEVVAEVVNGRFETSIVFPVPVRPDGVNRVTYYAYTADYDCFASGKYTLMNIGDFDPEHVITDTEAPEITAFYINDPAFASGDEVSGEVIAHIEIAADASGFDVSVGKIGTAPSLLLDDATSYQSIAYSLSRNHDGSVSIEYPISGLSDGFHTLRFSISDNVGNRSTASIGFVYVNRSAQAALTVNEVARDEVQFDVVNNFRNDLIGSLVIENAAGDAVYTRQFTEASPLRAGEDTITWDLVGNDGKLVPDGRYAAYLIVKSEHQYGNSERVSFVVIK